MIVLTTATDSIRIQVTTQLNYAAAALPWYCSWNISAPTPPGAPFGRSFGIVPGAPVSPVITMVPFLPGSNQLEIREITVCNTVPVAINPPITNPPPIGAISQMAAANVIIYFVDSSGPLPIPYQLFQCVLQPGDILSYNATPGVNGTWTIFDARGQKVV